MKYYPFFLLLSLLYGACNSSSDINQQVENSPSTTNSNSSIEALVTLPKAIVQQDENWMKAINNSEYEKLSAFYREEAGLFSEGAFIQGKDAIANRLGLIMKSAGKLSMKNTDFVIKQDSNHYFETGQYQFSNTAIPPSAFVIGWKKENGIWLHELEIIDPLIAAEEIDLEEIDQARKLWQERSNAQDHTVLVSKSYASEAYYFNRGRIYQGTESINEVYRYMSDAKWHITLTPLSVKTVQEDLVYELGRYNSGGIGHYVILWEKQEDETWQVLLDFNF